MTVLDDVTQMQSLLDVSAGKKSGDLLLTNVQILDVFTETVFDGEILISDGKIASITHQTRHHAMEIYDAKGRIAVPGFMDSHFHLDFPLVTPAQLSTAVVPHGTTSILCEILDFAALNGMAATRQLAKDTERLPYHCFWAAPGKVASKFSTEEVLNWENTVCLGEMTQPLLERGEPDELHKIALARSCGKVISGHVVQRAADELDAFAILGYDDEHNTDTYPETVDRMRFGMAKIIRMNAAYNAADSIISGVLRDGLPTDQLLFAVDDIYIHDIFRKGHIDSMIQHAIDLGMNPIKAIKIATLNPARHFHIEHLIGSITPGRFADFVLLDRLDCIEPRVVFQKGNLVAEDGRLTCDVQIDYSCLKSPSRPGLQDLSCTDLLLHPADAKTVCFCIANGKRITSAPYTLPIHSPVFFSDPQLDIQTFYRIERYPTFGARVIEKKLLQGTGIHAGALAMTFEQGGSSISAVGANPEDILLAVQTVDQLPGGMAVALDGKIIAQFTLNLGASISDLDAATASLQLQALESAILQLGCSLDGALMRLYFLPFYFRK